MRHLISYKLYEDKFGDNDLESDVKDMMLFLQIEDSGYEIHVDMKPQGLNVFYVEVINSNYSNGKMLKNTLQEQKIMFNKVVGN